MLALIAGQGELPVILSRELDAKGQAFILCELEGFPASSDINFPDRRVFRIEKLGSLIRDLIADGVKSVCLAGAIQRPAIDPSAIDAETLPFVPVMMEALQAGDDGALRAVISIFEDSGLNVVGADVIAPDLLPAPTAAPSDNAVLRDAMRGAQIVAAMGAIDIGQACAVHKEQALAVEAQPGTDAMLRALADQRDGQQGGLLYKAPKPGQDRRVDLPAIGPQTVTLAARAGLSGIVIEAGGVMVLDRPGVNAALADADLFLWVRDPN